MSHAIAETGRNATGEEETTVSMSEPFLPVPPGQSAPDGREIDLDHDVDVFLDDAGDGGADDLPSSATEHPPFRTPVPGGTFTEQQLDDDLGLDDPPIAKR